MRLEVQGLARSAARLAGEISQFGDVAIHMQSKRVDGSGFGRVESPTQSALNHCASL
jgi:hypothetical protein